MNILVTGGCGFIGSHLTPRLLECGHHVTLFDSCIFGQRPEQFPVKVIQADVRDSGQLKMALRGMDMVIHLAAHTRVMDSIADPLLNFDVNVAGTFGLLKAMLHQGVLRLINASTAGAIAGNAPPPVSETTPAYPISPYGASKLAAEAYCSAFAGTYNLQTCSLRFSNVYGPHSLHKSSAVVSFLKRTVRNEELTVYGDGSAVRDYVFVQDVCDGILLAIGSGATGVFQLGSGIPVSIRKLLRVLRSTVNRELRIRYAAARSGEIERTYCDITKARRELLYNPRTSLQDGLSQTWASLNAGR